MKKAGIVISLSLCLILLSTSAFAGGWGNRYRGQTVITCARFSHNDFTKPDELEIHQADSRVLIRNLDLRYPIRLIRVVLVKDNTDPDDGLQTKIRVSGRSVPDVTASSASA